MIFKIDQNIDIIASFVKIGYVSSILLVSLIMLRTTTARIRETKSITCGFTTENQRRDTQLYFKILAG